MIAVSATRIQAIGYNADEKLLHVQFRGGATYAHTDVGGEDYRRFMASPTKDQHYGDHFKGRRAARKVGL